MHGNAWEWVQDWSALYEDVPQVGPKGPDEGTYRIVRGGIFMGDAVGLRTAFRYGGSQDYSPRRRRRPPGASGPH
jgi:formylglycine-generating enzyme required for sulfatase activity